MSAVRLVGTWDADEADRYPSLGIDKSVMDGASGWGTTAMAVGSYGPFSELAGRTVLEAGGSATDALITTALTPTALAAGSSVSYAGVFGMVHAQRRPDRLGERGVRHVRRGGRSGEHPDSAAP